jgi:hypothetical protein
MHVRLGVVSCVVVLLGTTTALADTYYQYRDQRTGRDVFVNRLDQVPRKYRAGAKIVLRTDDAHADPAPEPPTEVIEVARDTGRPVVRTVAPAPKSALELRQALASSKAPWKDAPVLVGNLMDGKLVTAGAPPLTGPERGKLGSLLVTFVVCAMIAGLASFIAWIVIIVMAVRNRHLWWAVLIFLLWPLSYVYLFRRVEKGRRVFKSLCSLALLSPALVGLVGMWRFYAWFETIIQARGGHL